MPFSTRRSFTRRTPRGFVGQHRLDGGPLIIAEFVAHDWRVQFRSLNHVRRGAANALNLLPLSAALRTWPGLLTAVAKNPQQTSHQSRATRNGGSGNVRVSRS
jgi:hypothetical protein